MTIEMYVYVDWISLDFVHWFFGTVAFRVAFDRLVWEMAFVAFRHFSEWKAKFFCAIFRARCEGAKKFARWVRRTLLKTKRV